MEEETLDQILLEQLHAAKNGHKLIKRLKKLIKNDPGVDALQHQNKIRIEFFENMIQDKSLLVKKIKKKHKQSDLYPEILYTKHIELLCLLPYMVII